MQEVDCDCSGVIEVGEFIDFMKKHIVQPRLKARSTTTISEGKSKRCFTTSTTTIQGSSTFGR